MEGNFEKVCLNCGAALEEEDVFCTNCGTKTEPAQEQNNAVDESNVNPAEKRKLNKKNSRIIFSVGALAVIAIVAFMIYSGMPIHQFKSALNSADTERAFAVYVENAGDSEFITRAEDITKDYIAKLQSDYISDQISYEYAFKALTEIDEIAEIGIAKTSLKELKDSKYFFALAETAFTQEDYSAALAYYELTIEEDTFNYEAAQKIIPEAVELLCQATLASANQSIESGKYASAYKALMEIDANYANEELKALRLEIKAKAYAEIEKTAQTMLDNADYPGAYKYLEFLGKEVISNEAKSMMDSAYDLFSAQKLAEAEERALAGAYQEAATMLIVATRQINVTEFSIKAREYQIEADRRAQKVFVVSCYAYDDIARKAIVVIQNNTDQVLTEYEVRILLFDKEGQPVKSDITGMAGDNLFSGWSTIVNVQPGATSGKGIYWDINTGISGTQIKACIYSAEFQDGTSWTNPNYYKWLEREKNQL